MTDNTETTAKQTSHRSWKPTLWVVTLILMTFLAGYIAGVKHSYQVLTETEVRVYGSQVVEEWKQTRQEDYDEWHAREDDEGYEDIIITLDDGSSVVERCHFTYDLKGVPGEYYYDVRPHKEQTECEQFSYEPHTGSVS